jgi:hypothetical protein
MEERDLKEYIVKLNDRNIQRQRETGFTLYAIFGGIIFCFFYLVDNLPILSSIIKDVNYLNITVIASNFLFLLTLFHLSYVTATRRQKLTRIFPFQEPLKIELGDFTHFLAYGLISTLNFVFINHHQNKLHLFYLWLFGIISCLNIISPFAINTIRQVRRRKKRKKGLSIEIIDFTFFNSQTIKTISIGFLINAIVLSAFSLLVLFNIKLTIDAKSIGEIVKYVAIFYGGLFLINILINIKSTQNDNNQLEDFEKEIYFDNISNADISKKFEQDFSGIPFSKWLVDKHTEILDFFHSKTEEFLAADLLIASVDLIDKQTLSYEYNGRLNDIIKIQMRLLDETNDFVQKVGTIFSNLKSFASLNEQEVQHLNYVQTFLNNNIRGFNNQYYNLSTQIEDRQKK